jgi:cell division protein FtsN
LARTERKTGLRRTAAALLLLGVGVALGLVIGNIWSVPSVLWDWWREPGQTLVLAPEAEEPPATAPLEAFRELQEGKPRPGPGRAQPARTEPDTVEPARAQPTQLEAQPRDVAARGPSPAEVPQDAATRAIARIFDQVETTDAPPGGEVVQVAAYRDLRSAEALARRLVRDGFKAYVSGKHPPGDLRHRVRVRPATGQDVYGLAGELEERGFGVWVTEE